MIPNLNFTKNGQIGDPTLCRDICMTARAVCRTKQQGITFVRHDEMDGSCLLCKVLRHLEFLHDNSNDTLNFTTFSQLMIQRERKAM